jgi:tyrosinase
MTQRKNAHHLTAAESGRYKRAIKKMLADITNPYGKLVAIHGDMSHDMHGMDADGVQRFLPWHRDYLLQFEKALQQIDPAAFIPYWDWTVKRTVPRWIKTFKPTVIVPGTGTVTVKRKSSIPATKKVATIMAKTTFTDFTTHLEGGPHNQVHNEIGGPNGTMADIMISPADPIFWLHHGNLDRLWSQWQAAHPGKNPKLTGAARIMDPWPQTETQLRSIATLGYSYV